MSDHIEPPLTYVRNIKPRDRNSLNCNGANTNNNNSRFLNKDVIEKKRLKERTFGHIRYDPQIINDPINPIPNKQQSLSYSNDIERFNTNISEYNLQEKNNKLNKHKLKIKHLTQERLNRDNERWDAMNYQYTKQENKLKKFNPIKNNPSMPYNPITLRYDDSFDGKRLEFQDKQAIYRAKLREKRLFEKQTCGYDPVTGKPKFYSNTIIKPETPKQLT
eukprot:182088_1